MIPVLLAALASSRATRSCCCRTVSSLVQVYCHARGFMASFHAGFDHSRAARQMLHDYVDGKLLYCHPPPNAKDLVQFTFEDGTTEVNDLLPMAPTPGERLAGVALLLSLAGDSHAHGCTQRHLHTQAPVSTCPHNSCAVPDRVSV